METLIWTDPGLGQYSIWNWSLRQVLPESRDGTTASRDWQNSLSKGRHGFTERETLLWKILIWDCLKGIKPYGHMVATLHVEWALTPRVHGLPWDWYAKAKASTIQWANLCSVSLPFLLTSVADKELLRASEAPGVVHVHAQCSYGTQQRQGWICLLRGQCLQVHHLIAERRGGNLGHVSRLGSQDNMNRPAQTQGTRLSPKMLGGPRPSWWKWARSGALSLQTGT